MITKDVRFEGFDARSWTNLLMLFAPGVAERLSAERRASDDPEAARDAPTPHRGTLVLVHDEDDRVLKAFHTTRGRVTELPYRGPASLPELRESYAAHRVVAIRRGVPEEVAEKLAMRLDPADDYLAQCLAFARILREMVEAGLIHVEPNPLAGIPVPTPSNVRRALDLVLPEERSVVLVAWDGGGLWTAVVLRRRGGGVDFVGGPDAIAKATGPLGGDFRRDHRVIVDAIERAIAPVHLGIFAEQHTLIRLLRDPRPGAWAKAAAVRDVVLHPAPPYVAVALGADAMRGVAERSSAWLGGMDALAPLGPVAQYVRGRVREIASVTMTLGFNPLQMLAEAHQKRDAPRSDW